MILQATFYPKPNFKPLDCETCGTEYAYGQYEYDTVANTHVVDASWACYSGINSGDKSSGELLNWINEELPEFFDVSELRQWLSAL